MLFSTSSNKIAVISKKGVITARVIGTTKIYTVKCGDGLSITKNIFTAIYNKDKIVVTFLGDDNKVAEDLIRSYLVFKSDKIKSELSI